MVTPMRPFEIILGKAIPAVVIGYADFVAMLAVTVWGFGVPFRGSLCLLLVLALFYLFVELGCGLIVSALSATQQQAILLAFLIMMPEMIVSGFAVPRACFCIRANVVHLCPAAGLRSACVGCREPDSQFDVDAQRHH